MGVNFFRFPFGSRRGGISEVEGEGDNSQAEQPRPLKEILKDVKSALGLLSYPDPKYKSIFVLIVKVLKKTYS